MDSILLLYTLTKRCNGEYLKVNNGGIIHSCDGGYVTDSLMGDVRTQNYTMRTLNRNNSPVWWILLFGWVDLVISLISNTLSRKCGFTDGFMQMQAHSLACFLKLVSKIIIIIVRSNDDTKCYCWWLLINFVLFFF